MSTPPESALRTNSLALAFQDVFTVVLRTRFSVQRWDNADRMRVAVGQMIAAATQKVRALGYTDESTQMTLYAIVGFLDESVLGSRDPVFADWSRKPLQEELFGDQLAGEKFFRHVAELLMRQESSEVADVLELHCLCLQLGFRGRYAFGDASEIHTIIRRIHDKIVRIRGPLALIREVPAPPVPKTSTNDRWLRNTAIAATVLAILCLVTFLGYRLLLNPSAERATPVVASQSHGPISPSPDRMTEIS